MADVLAQPASINSPSLQAGLDALSGNPPAAGINPLAAPVAPAAPGLANAIPGVPAAPGLGQRIGQNLQDAVTPDNAPAVFSSPGGWSRAILSATIPALSTPKPGSFGDKLKQAASGLTGSLGDAAAAGENVRPGSGWLGGLEKTAAARNTRLANQKQQQFLNTNEEMKTKALVAQENAATMHDQMLIAQGGREMQEAAAVRDTAAMQPLLHPAPGAQPAQIIAKNINSDALQQGVQEHIKDQTKGYDPTVLHVFHTGNEEVPGKFDANGLPLMRATYTVLGKLPDVDVSTDNAAFINQWAPHALPGGPLSVDPNALMRLPGEQYSSLYQQAASAETAAKTDALARKEAGIKAYNVQLTGEAQAIGADWGVALSKAGGDYQRAMDYMTSDPTMKAKYPNAAQDIMKRQADPKDEADTGERAWAKIVDDQRKTAQEIADKKLEQLPKTPGEAVARESLARQNYAANQTPENKQKLADATDTRVAMYGAEQSQKRADELAAEGDPNAAAALLVNGTVAPVQLISSRKPEFAQAAFTAAHKLDPTWTAQKADADFKIASSPNNTTFFGSVNSLLEPGGTLDQLAARHTSLGNGNFPAVNTYKDLAKAQMGTPDLAAFRQSVLGVADDYSKVMGGGTGTDAARNEIVKSLSYAYNNGQFDNALAAARQALSSQKMMRIGRNSTLFGMYSLPGEQMPAAPTTNSRTNPNVNVTGATPGGAAGAANPFAKYGGKPVQPSANPNGGGI